MPSIQDDTDGAIMVMAVFMAMIAIGALYYMVGIGDSILAQERMQDAADASAFSGAVIHARGMNILALLNIMMAALLSILVLLSMLSSLFAATAIVLAAISWLVPAVIPFISPAHTASRGFNKAERTAKKPVYATLKALHALQKPLNKAVPVIASLNAAKLSGQNYGDVVTVGITFPIFNGLPTTQGSFKTLCTKAGQYVGALVAKPISAILGTSGYMTGKIISKAEGLGEGYASFYCGDGPKPSSPVFSEKVSIPELNTPAKVTCETSGNENACSRYEKQVERMKDSYDYATGECKSDDEHIQDKWICDGLRRRARRDCNPKNSSEFILDYTWVEHRYTRHFTLEGEGGGKYVKEHDLTDSRYEEVSGDGIPHIDPALRTPVPCHHPQYLATQEMTKWDESRSIAEPLCETKFKKPKVRFFEQTNRLSFDQKILEVRDVLRCTVKKKIVAELKGEKMDAKDKDSMTPQEMCSCAELGEEDFQVRAVVLGDAKKYTHEADKKILIATQGKKASVSPIEGLAGYGGRVAAAQAEYYFSDASKGRAEWLWNLKWKARMRRLAMGRKAFQCKKQDSCDKSQKLFGEGLKGISGDQKEKLGAFRSVLKGADNLIVH